MGRILAIDFGTKRVGLAVTDPLQIIASALETVHSKDVLTYLENYFNAEKVTMVVLGMPKKLDNSDTNNTIHVINFHKKFQQKFPEMPIVLHDERFTSAMAMKAMIAGGMSKKNRREKANVDKVSATIILQSYMEALAM